MSNLNHGCLSLNKKSIPAGESTAYCVLGMPRGGTTMASRLLEAAGVFMGHSLPFTAEDPMFASILMEKQPDENKLYEVINSRNQTFPQWGFKAPFRIHWKLLESIPNIRFIIIFRDIFAVASRNHLSAGANVFESMVANTQLQARLAHFARETEHPTLMISYEKTLVMPKAISAAILSFVGREMTAEAIERLTQVVVPNERQYVSSSGSSDAGITLHVDHLNRDSVSGWACSASGEAVSLSLYINDTFCKTFAATIARQDLANKFGNDGAFGFKTDIDASRLLPKKNVISLRDPTSQQVYFSRAL